MSAKGKMQNVKAALFGKGGSFFILPFALVLLALGLRLLVWRWHEPYPLGGDEREYLAQALTLLRERRYVELRLMRPPLYTGFLAASIYLLDSLVQRLRLVQAVLSALTVLPIYALAWRIVRERRAAALAALLAALSYTLAAAATELLTETLFLFGLATFFWLLLDAPGAGRPAPSAGPALLLPALAGLTLGCLALVRSVALPLLPLGALWLAVNAKCKVHSARHAGPPILIFTFAFCTLVAPWMLRNYRTYGALIVVDTTGAENLWLDNDPAGREAVKAQLYALGDDMAARQRLATARGLEVILADPARFLRKAWGEAQRFFALQFFDDMRERRAIWVPPHEAWLRLLLGDGLWLLTLLAGAAGLWLAPATVRPDPRWLLAPWALYVLLTGMLFHVELRYRLPLYPALLPYAGWALARVADWRAPQRRVIWRSPYLVGAALTVLACVGLMLLHRPYLSESWMLARKHAALWRAERALAAGDGTAASDAARAALAQDPESALARVALAQAALLSDDLPAARAWLDEAVAAVPDHPQAHVMRGLVLRALAEPDAARADLAYETATLQDMQRWAWEMSQPMLPPQWVDVGDSLALGFVRGFHPIEQHGLRWTRGEADVRLWLPDRRLAYLELRLASVRPINTSQPEVTVLVDGTVVGTVRPVSEWFVYRIRLPDTFGRPDEVIVTLRSDTYRPRDFDRASPDNRALGVMVDHVGLATP